MSQKGTSRRIETNDLSSQGYETGFHQHSHDEEYSFFRHEYWKISISAALGLEMYL